MSPIKIQDPHQTLLHEAEVFQQQLQQMLEQAKIMVAGSQQLVTELEPKIAIWRARSQPPPDARRSECSDPR